MIKLKKLLLEGKEASRLEQTGTLTPEISDDGSSVDIVAWTEPKIWHGRISLLYNTPYEDLGSPPPLTRYLFIDTITAVPKHEGYGYFLYKTALIYIKKKGYKGLVSSKNHRSADADNIWGRLKTFSDKYYDYVDIKDLGTKLTESATLTERKLDLSKKEDAAEYIIKKVWPHVPKEDRYDSYQVLLWLDNEQGITNEAYELAKKFYPEEEDPMFSFTNDVKSKLEQMEQAFNHRRAKKLDPQDSLQVLKVAIKDKPWELAKTILYRNSLGGSMSRESPIPDKEAEEIFNRLYRIAMGETMYGEETANRHGRLSELRVVPDAEQHSDQSAINSFIRYYCSYDAMGFPPNVKVFRGTNNPHAKIRPGDFVSLDESMARDFARGKYGTLLRDILNSDDLYVNKVDCGRSELVYWPKGHQIQKYTGHIPTFKEFWENIIIN